MMATGTDNSLVDRSTQRRKILIPAVLLVIVTLLAYSPALSGGFVWDDGDHVSRNPLLRDAGGLTGIWTPAWAAESRGSEFHTKQYYPLVFTTFWIEYHLWGLDTLGYHLLNVLLHLAAVMLIWRVLARIGLPSGAALAAAALFALHPVHVESVAWITERKNVLSTVFYLGSLLAFLRFDDLREGVRERTPRDGPAPWYVASMMMFVGALLSKSVTCSLPAAIVLLMVWQRRVSVRRLAPLVPFFILGILAALNTGWHEANIVGAEGPEWDRSLAERLIVACTALLFYPWKLLVPLDLVFIYPRWTVSPANVAAWWPVIVVGAIGAGAAYLMWKWRGGDDSQRGGRGVILLLALYAGTILPALGFFDIYPHQYSFVADHFNYLSSIGVIAAAVVVTGWLIRNPITRVAITLIVCAVFAALTSQQTQNYRDVETLYRVTLERNPDAWIAHNNLGTLLVEQARAELTNGETEAAGQTYAAAREHFQSAVDLNPRHHRAMHNLSIVLRQERAFDAGLALAIRAIETLQARGDGRQIPADYLYMAGELSELTGNDHDALDYYRRTLVVDERNVNALLALGRLETRLGEYVSAESRFGTLLQINPGFFEAMNGAGDVYVAAGLWADARRAREEATQMASTAEQQIEAGYKLTWLLATCPDAAGRDPARSVQVGEGLVQATQRRAPEALDALAAALASAERYPEAIELADEAIALAERLGFSDMAEAFRARRALYEADTPYRDE